MANHYIEIIFTKHALERLSHRSITQEMVHRTISQPDATKLLGDGKNKFQKTINQRKIQVVAQLLPEKKWLIISVWVRGEDDRLPLAWQLLTLPFRLVWRLLKLVIRILLQALK